MSPEKEKARSEKILRKKWGDRYDRNLDIVNSILRDVNQATDGALLAGLQEKGSKGVMRGNDPDIAIRLLNLGMEMVRR